MEPWHTRIGDAGTRALLQAAKRGKLRDLYLRGNEITILPEQLIGDHIFPQSRDRQVLASLAGAQP